MAENSYFMNSTPDDRRIYDAQDFAFVMQTILGSPYTADRVGTGVSRYYKGIESDQLLVVTANGANMVTTVSVGAAAVFGQFYELTEAKQIVHQAANNTLVRVDRIVLRLDNRIDQRRLYIDVKTGTPSTNRTPPALTWTDEVKEIALASVDIVAGRSYITQADVLDTRAYKEVCGFLPLHNFLRGLEVDSNGISSQPNNCYVEIETSNGTPQTWADRAIDVVDVRNYIIEDRQNEMKGTKYTPKTGGVYLISGYVTFDEGQLNAGTDVLLQMFKNDSYNTMIFARTCSDSKDNIFKGTEVVQLGLGDTLDLRLQLKGTQTSYNPRGFRIRIAKMF